MAKKITVDGGFYRSMKIDPASLDKQARTVRVQMSSEYPVRRRIGGMVVNEILGHGEGECDLSRVNGGTAVCLEHDMSMRCGITEAGKLTGNGTAEGVLRFSRTPIGDQAMNEVEDGTLRWVSAGYTVSRMVEQDSEDKDGIPNARATSWQIFEVSLVGAPADPTCRIRAGENQTQEITFERSMKRTLLLDADPPAKPGNGAAAVDPGKTERERASELRKLGKQFRGKIENVDDLVDEAIEREVAVPDFQRTLLGKLSTPAIPGGSEAPQNRDGTDTGNSGGTQTINVRSLGEELVKSAIFRAFASKKSGNFQIEIPGNLREHLTRATLLSTGLTSIQKVPGVILVDQNPNRIADLFMQGTTNATTIRFTKESSFTNAATAVAEEGQKPEATFSLAETDVTVQKIAVIGRVSDEMIADYDYVQSYVNGQLLFMVAALEDNHLVNGTGLSNQITGVLSVSGIQTHAYAADIFTTVHKAKTKVNSTPGFVGGADTIVINPADYQNARLTTDSNGQYLLGGPSFGQYGAGGLVLEPPIWGLRPIITTAIAQGTAIVGNFKAGATLFRKGGVTLESTNSDASDFQYNRICIRAEERLALVPWKPKAFCKITGIPPA